MDSRGRRHVRSLESFQLHCSIHRTSPSASRWIVMYPASDSVLVLHQDGGPIAFLSWAVAPQHAKLAAYEHKLIGLVKAVRHWRL